MTGTAISAIEGVEPGRFGDVVATLWRRRNWRVTPTAFDDRLYEANRGEDGARERRALVTVYRSPGGSVGAAAVRDRARVAFAADGTTLATNAGFTPGAVEVAAAHGVDLVGRDDLARLVDAVGVADLLDGDPAEGANASEDDPGVLSGDGRD